jgi:hypothetical protein
VILLNRSTAIQLWTLSLSRSRVAFMIGILTTPGAPKQSPGEATCRNEKKTRRKIMELCGITYRLAKELSDMLVCHA